ncbi:MAG: right-handed parallel beta-helix repeat-containing protein [Euryarchaeota archaeon]|nr:right-handed parallel beta-helix repeat-containing protein [Euryarchaeota archaeon]
MRNSLVVCIFTIIILISALIPYNLTAEGTNSGYPKREHLYINEKNVKDLVTEGVLKGSGTPEDPYVLENYILYGPVLPALWIVNISNIVIKNVVISPGKNVSNWGRTGITIQNASNVVIESVSVSYMVQGIIAYNVHDLKIEKLSAIVNPDSGYAIQLYNCTDVQIKDVNVFSGHVLLVDGASKENFDIEIKNVYKVDPKDPSIKYPYLYYFSKDRVILSPGELTKDIERIYGGLYVAYSGIVILDGVYFYDDVIVVNSDSLEVWNTGIRDARFGLLAKNVPSIGVYSSWVYNAIYGIYVENADHVEAKSCIINYTTWGIFLVNVKSFNISNDYIRRSSSNAIYIKNSRNGRISYNLILDVGSYGIWLSSGTENVTITKNNIYLVGRISEFTTGYGADYGKNNEWYSNFYGPMIPSGIYNISGTAQSSDDSPLQDPIPILRVSFGKNTFLTRENVLYVGVEVITINDSSNDIDALRGFNVTIYERTYTAPENATIITTYVERQGDTLVVEYDSQKLIIPLPEKIAKHSFRVLGYVLLGIGVTMLVVGTYMTRKTKKSKK